MEYKEFLKCFDTITICWKLNYPWTIKTKQWESDPGMMDVEYRLTVEDKVSEAMVSFSQMGRRQLRDEHDSDNTLHSINLQVYKFENGKVCQIRGFEKKGCAKLRTRTFSGYLKRGDYKIVCSATVLDEVTSFFLRIATTSRRFNLKLK